MATWPANAETDWNTKMLAYLAIGHDTDGTHKATEVTAVVTGEGLFGSWTDKDSGGSNALAKDEVYRAGSDGFVSAYTTATQSYVEGYTDSSNPPTTLRSAAIHAGGSFGDRPNGFPSMPVKKDDYFKITSDEAVVTIYWLPIGSGTCVKQ